MINCRNPRKLGFSKYQCPKDPEQYIIIPHTCKCSICQTCAKIRNDKWGEDIKNHFPKGKYYHLTFTIPKEFRYFFSKEDPDWQRKNEFYQLAGFRVFRLWESVYKNENWKVKLFEFLINCWKSDQS